MYPLLPLIGNLGPIISGLTISYVSKLVSSTFSYDNDVAFEVTLKVLTLFMLLSGGVVSLLHQYVYRITDREKAIEEAELLAKELANKHGKKNKIDKKTINITQSSVNNKSSPTLIESINLLKNDDYLKKIAIIVLSYGLSMEFLELIWKAVVKTVFPIKTEYLKFMSKYSTLVGTFSFLMIFIGSRITQAFGWRGGALLTPALMGVSSLAFFGFLIFGKRLGMNGQIALLMTVYVGLLQNVLIKASKYSVFDPIKEMTYIPLDDDQKLKGKTVIDILGVRFGKAGSAFILQLLVLLFGNIISGAPVVSLLFYVIIFNWIGTFFYIY